MRFAVPSHLAFCTSPSGVTFLDVRRDRYFALPIALERDFQSWLEVGRQETADISAARRLQALGVLEPVGVGTHAPRAVVPPTLRWPAEASWMDTPPELGTRGSIGAGVAAFTAVFRAQARLRRQTLESLLGQVGSPRRSTATPSNVLTMAGSVRTFHAARRWSMAQPVCLLDSLALMDFLGRKGFRPHLVFGVIRQPFHAHCWVQAQGVVLNDSLDHVLQYTPILVV